MSGTFEQAVDAIVEGNAAGLDQLLSADPELVHARSARDHQATLLHYTAANGVEDVRQKTPPNIVAIAELLLNAGADVNSRARAYGGELTTLELAATSVHPEKAGVQIPLLELLLNRGARMDGNLVNACLRNGRGQAAVFLADRGAPLDLEGAAGVGRLDEVKRFFANESAQPPQPMLDAFAWACEFGHSEVAEFLLARGVAVNAKLKHHGQTGLHWAAHGGHVDTMTLLLDKGAPVDAKDETYDGTPLDWAFHGWKSSSGAAGRDRYYETVARLARAGGTAHTETIAQCMSDSRMMAALDGHYE